MLKQQLLRFLMAGGIATACQYATLIVLVEAIRFNEVVASALGYTVGAAVNYILNYHVTFSSKARHLPTLVKFSTIVVLGLGLNTLIMYLCHAVIGVHYMASQLTATAVVLVWNFVGHKCWTYNA